MKTYLNTGYFHKIVLFPIIFPPPLSALGCHWLPILIDFIHTIFLERPVSPVYLGAVVARTGVQGDARANRPGQRSRTLCPGSSSQAEHVGGGGGTGCTTAVPSAAARVTEV